MEHIYYVYLLPAIWLHKGLIELCHYKSALLTLSSWRRAIYRIHTTKRQIEKKCTGVTPSIFLYYEKNIHT